MTRYGKVAVSDECVQMFADVGRLWMQASIGFNFLNRLVHCVAWCSINLLERKFYAKCTAASIDQPTVCIVEKDQAVFENSITRYDFVTRFHLIQ